MYKRNTHTKKVVLKSKYVNHLTLHARELRDER